MDLRQVNKANRQKQVIANAARFFSSIGYDLTTIGMVAERSNMSPATIYNNFENTYVCTLFKKLYQKLLHNQCIPNTQKSNK